MKWERFSCGDGGGKFNGECGFCLDNVEKHIAGLESKLNAKATALCTANDRYDTVVEERDAALSRLEAREKQLIERQHELITRNAQLAEALEFIRGIADDTYTDGVPWNRARDLLKGLVVENQSLIGKCEPMQRMELHDEIVNPFPYCEKCATWHARDKHIGSLYGLSSE